jgi:hypothetical protein
VNGEFTGREHVEVGVDGVVVECDKRVRPWRRTGFRQDGCRGGDKAGVECGEGGGAGGGLTDGVL